MKATKTWVLIFLLLIPIIPFGTDALAMLVETEPNNTFSQANTFQLNGEEFAGQLSSGSDVDVFKFNVSTQGILSFSIGSAYNGYGSLRATIQDSSSNILASKSFWGYSGAINLMANVSMPGYYYLVIDHGGFTDDYKIIPNSVLPETVIVNPNTIDAPWTLTGPNGYSTTGIGDQTLSNLPIGDYMIIWGDIPGWIKPSPATETKALTSGGTITFSGTYVQQTIPIIQVTPLSLNFNYVPVGSTKDLFLTVKNMGGGTLTGNATAEAPFSIVSGVSYSLGPDQSQVITVRYQPTSQGPHTGMVVFTGGDGATVSVTGKTEKPLGLPWLLLLLGN